MLPAAWDRAISLLGVLFIAAAPVAAAVIFQNLTRPKIAAEAPATRKAIVESSIVVTPVSTFEEQGEEEPGNAEAAREAATEATFRLTSTPAETADALAAATSGSFLRDDKLTAHAATLAQNTLREQIQRYRRQHNGVNPLSTLIDLTQRTDGRGVIGQGFPFGPYLPEIPENPLTQSAAVKSITNDPATPEDLTPGGGGWLYNARTGNIWLDHPEFLEP